MTPEPHRSWKLAGFGTGRRGGSVGRQWYVSEWRHGRADAGEPSTVIRYCWFDTEREASDYIFRHRSEEAE